MPTMVLPQAPPRKKAAIYMHAFASLNDSLGDIDAQASAPADTAIWCFIAKL